MSFPVREIRNIPFGTLVLVDLPDGDDFPIPLGIEEALYAAALPAARRATWVGGRVALHAALDASSAPFAGAILSTDRGAPAMPAGFLGSVSHKPTLAAGLVARDDPAMRAADRHRYRDPAAAPLRHRAAGAHARRASGGCRAASRRARGRSAAAVCRQGSHLQSARPLGAAIRLVPGGRDLAFGRCTVGRSSPLSRRGVLRRRGARVWRRVDRCSLCTRPSPSLRVLSLSTSPLILLQRAEARG